MIPKNCKRLAEADFPVAVVSAHAAREKSIRHGHPSTLHLWWARRPLASCRAMLLAILLPDPADPNCPAQFKNSARNIFAKLRTSAFNPKKSDDLALREILLHFIGEFANWDNANNSRHINAARQLVQAAHGEDKPLVADPFAGGGSIPLEALRIGCDAFASDLNPVACLILRAMLEEIPRRGPELADQLRQLGEQVKKQAEQKLAPLYPIDPDGAIPIAYLWARTIQCESTNCGAEIPLIHSFWLVRNRSRNKKQKPEIAVRCKVVRSQGKIPTVAFEIFKPNSNKDVSNGTVKNGVATCICCGTVMPSDRVRAQLASKHGGADVVFSSEGLRIGGARMFAVVSLRPGEPKRHYRLPTAQDYQAVKLAHESMAAMLENWESENEGKLSPVPGELINPTRPSPNARGMSAVTRYGIRTFGDLFTMRQAVALVEQMRLVRKIASPVNQMLFALLAGKGADGNNSLCRWESMDEGHINQFSRQALSMAYDFCEATPATRGRGAFFSAVGDMGKVIEHMPEIVPGNVQQADACKSQMPDEAAAVWFTDPPYYDAIPYADLSDFFFVLLKRMLPTFSMFGGYSDIETALTPKAQECVWNSAHMHEGKPKDGAFYENSMAQAFIEGRRVLQEDGIGTVVFAHKTTDGWESLISGIIRGGWTITGSWPIATEMPGKIGNRNKAMLLTSVHIICRPRSVDAQVGEWADVSRELPIRVGDWMERLQGEGVRGADLIFACIGPALEVFSRYSRVEKPDGTVVALSEYLKRVWEVVARTALEKILGTEEAKARNGAAGAVEEDARLTALFLWTMRSTKGIGGEEKRESEEDEGKVKAIVMSLPYDVVRRFAQPLGINLEEWEERIMKTDNGVVSLLPVASRSRSLLGDNTKISAAQIRQISELGRGLFGEEESSGRPAKGRKAAAKSAKSAESAESDFRGRTTLDRVHTAMLLHKNGQSAALRDLVRRENERGPHFMRLVNSLAGLYPRGGEELRWVEGVALYAK